MSYCSWFRTIIRHFAPPRHEELVAHQKEVRKAVHDSRNIAMATQAEQRRSRNVLDEIDLALKGVQDRLVMAQQERDRERDGDRK